jgi:tetratricopeptide (TPR) repeat protein
MKLRLSLIGLVLGGLIVSCSTQPPAATTPTSDVNAMIRNGMQLLENGKTDKAIEELSKAVALNSASAKPHNFLGMAFFNKKDYLKAGEQFQKAIDIDGNFASAYNNLGGVDILMEKYDDAIEHFGKAIALDPKNVSAHFGLGSLLLLKKQEEEGLRLLTKAVAMDPSFLERNSFLISTQPFNSSAEMMFDYAKAFAASGNADQAAVFLAKAKSMGFKNWQRILEDKEFESVRQETKIREFVK